MKIEWIVNEFSRFPEVQKNRGTLPFFCYLGVMSLLSSAFAAEILPQWCQPCKLENCTGVKIINVNNLI